MGSPDRGPEKTHSKAGAFTGNDYARHLWRRRCEHRSRLHRRCGCWREHAGRHMSQRVTKPDAEIVSARGQSMRRGILPFLNDGSEVQEELTVKYRGSVQGRGSKT